MAVWVTEALIGEQQVRGVDSFVEVLDGHCRGEREANGGSEERDGDDGPEFVARDRLLARFADLVGLGGDGVHAAAFEEDGQQVDGRLAVCDPSVNHILTED